MPSLGRSRATAALSPGPWTLSASASRGTTPTSVFSVRGINLAPWRERNAATKPVLIALLRLQDEIVRAAAAARDAFDRQYYDELWHQWQVLQAQDTINP
jgi:hypothetical protein